MDIFNLFMSIVLAGGFVGIAFLAIALPFCLVVDALYKFYDNRGMRRIWKARRERQIAREELLKQNKGE